jgi:His/Glu/Gln/Arg/opine family amino acid ABC transporter permease subunit
MWETIVKIFAPENILFMLRGMRISIIVAICAVLMGIVLGILGAVCKMSRSKLLRVIGNVYVEFIRGTPMLLQLYLFYFALPQLIPFLNRKQYLCVAIALVCNSAAYVSEIIRSGIQAVDIGQTEAARSLGMSSRLTMTEIILPQAIKNILPALGNEFIMIVKDTSLASTFFIGDLMTQCLLIKGTTYLTMEPLIMVAVVYFVVTYGLSKLLGMFERRLRRGDIR